MRLQTGRLTSRANPAHDYAAAVARVAAFDADVDDSALNPRGRTLLLTHGAAADRAVVLLHGYTNCPQQFRLLGEQLHAQGANVLIPRMPGHGLSDRMTTGLSRLSAEHLTTFADRAVDCAAALGRRVIVAGISTGGVLAGWLAHRRPEVDTAMLIAPVFGLKPVPAPLTGLAARFLLATPNQFIWWGDPESADDGPQTHAYPRFSTRGLGQILRIGAAVRREARRRRPSARRLIVVTNENDGGINADVAAGVAAAWRRRGAAVTTYLFSAEHRLDHDLIDPDHPDQNVALVYPVLHDLLAATAP